MRSYRASRPIRVVTLAKQQPGPVTPNLRIALRAAMARKLRLSQSAIQLPISEEPATPPSSPASLRVQALESSQNTDSSTDHRDQSDDQPGAPVPTPLSDRIARAILRDNHNLLALRYLATQIGDFCGTLQVNEQGPWEADLELRPDILPASHLWIRLSQEALSLRFICRDANARNLVWNGRHRLRDMLHHVLQVPCEVDIHVV